MEGSEVPVSRAEKPKGPSLIQMKRAQVAARLGIIHGLLSRLLPGNGRNGGGQENLPKGNYADLDAKKRGARDRARCLPHGQRSTAAEYFGGYI